MIQDFKYEQEDYIAFINGHGVLVHVVKDGEAIKSGAIFDFAKKELAEFITNEKGIEVTCRNCGIKLDIDDTAMHTCEFNNWERNRYYGVRVGDEVEEHFGDRITTKGTVVDYGFMDNNAVFVEREDGKVVSCVAEWCTIIKKVEDK